MEFEYEIKVAVTVVGRRQNEKRQKKITVLAYFPCIGNENENEKMQETHGFERAYGTFPHGPARAPFFPGSGVGRELVPAEREKKQY